MSLSQLEQESKFKKHLSEYWNSKGITQIKIPQIGGQQLNLFKLYKAVCKKGGGQAVSHNKLWKQIVDEFGLPSTCTSASFTLKNHYQKYLLGYQQRFFFGKDDSADLPQLVAGRQRKPLKQGQTIIISNRFNGYRPQGQVVQSTLASELKRYYEKNDPNQHINFIKRTKMYPVMSQVKHMILAFQSPAQNERIYAINMLLLFSMNTQAPFLFSQYPNVLQSVSYFIQKIYPPINITSIQYLRTITLAIRNLLINHKNLQPFLQSSLLDDLSKIFQEKLDQQTIRNISDIFSSLSRLGWENKELFEKIQQYLDKESHENLQTGIDLLRSLVELKEQQCENILYRKLDFFSRLLLHPSIQIRESILQIFAYITDKSQKIRILCLNNLNFMQRLLALMSNSLGIFQKQAQISCLIINNISQLNKNQSYRIQFLQKMKLLEKKLLLISFNDDSLSPITSSILFYLSGRISKLQGFKQQDNQKILYKIRKNIDRDVISSQQDQDQDSSQDQQDQDQSQDQQDIDQIVQNNQNNYGENTKKKIHTDNHHILPQEEQDQSRQQQHQIQSSSSQDQDQRINQDMD